jgi:putative SOS response-associated peptidase YedK
MCGRFTLSSNPAAVADSLDLPGLFDTPLLLEPRYNIAPSQAVASVRADAAGACTLALLRWGLLPSWSRDNKAGFINARSETAPDKPAFRVPFRKRRCLVLADGWFEWQQQGQGQKKQPWYFRRADGQPFAFAGLWDCWHGGDDGAALETCALLTTSPNDLMRPVHDRMPVLLDRGDFDLWLDPKTPSDGLRQLLRPCDAAALVAFPVGTVVNNPRHDSPACVESIDLARGDTLPLST